MKKIFLKLVQISYNNIRKLLFYYYKLAKILNKLQHYLVSSIRPKSNKLYKILHHHSAQKPHEYLMAKSKHYLWWHSWNYRGVHHGHVHGFLAAAWIFIVAIVFITKTSNVSALSTWSQTDWSGGAG